MPEDEEEKIQKRLKKQKKKTEMKSAYMYGVDDRFIEACSENRVNLDQLLRSDSNHACNVLLRPTRTHDFPHL